MNDNVFYNLTNEAMSNKPNFQKFGDINWSFGHDDKVVILHYNARCMIHGNFNQYERVCRGLIIDRENGIILARPYDKFFNYGERGIYPDSTVNITHVVEKIDGSLGILYWYKDQPYISTKGVLNSEQGVWATDWFRTFYQRKRNWDRENTYLFEIIYPENQVVVNYGDAAGLIYLDQRNIETGDYYLSQKASTYNYFLSLGISVPELYDYNIKDIKNKLNVLNNFEGFVVYFNDSSIWKFKTEDYLRFHKTMSQSFEDKVLELIHNDLIDDYLPRLNHYKLKQVNKIIEEYWNKYKYIENLCLMAVEIFNSFSEEMRTNKVLSFASDNNPNIKKYKDIIFMMVYNKDYHKRLSKIVIEELKK